MTFFAIYDEITGRILRTGSAPEAMVALQQEPGARYVITPTQLSDATHFVSDVNIGLWAEKPPIDAVLDKDTVRADGVDTVTITGLPDWVQVRISGPASDSFDVDDNAITLNFDYPGVYKVEMRALNYLTLTLSIEALRTER